MGGQEHFYLENQCCICVPFSEHGEMEVFSSTQNPTHTQHLVAEVLGVPNNRIVARTKRLGGGFGGKESRSFFVSTATAVAARKLKRPVRCAFQRYEDMMSTGGRHPFLAKYKVGFTKEGVVTALDIDMYSNAGYSIDLSISVMDRALFHMDNAYLIPNIRGVGRVCKTNLPTNTAFRGFGGPQVRTTSFASLSRRCSQYLPNRECSLPRGGCPTLPACLDCHKMLYASETFTKRVRSLTTTKH